MLATLSRILQPQGIKVVTTGADEIGSFLARRYGSTDDAVVQARWRETLEKLTSAKVVLLGVPMDIGAGFERGAFKGPLGIRSQLLRVDGLYQRLEEAGVVDIGDVRVNPSLFMDELMSDVALAAVRRARDWSEDLPVAPLSILDRAVREIAKVAPEARVHLLGGDHSMSMVTSRLLAEAPRNAKKTLGVVHFDAHTDLLRERDGIQCSFATWAHHANEAIGRGGRLQQLGTRISGRTREDWEREGDLRQFWCDEIDARGAAAIQEELVANLKRAGVSELYVSNDVDGTDPRWVAATGTMVRGGMHPAFVSSTIEVLGEHFQVLGADVAELAPPLKWHVPGEPARSNQMAAHYALKQIEAMLGLSGAPATERGRFGDAVPIPAPATEAEVWNLPPYA